MSLHRDLDDGLSVASDEFVSTTRSESPFLSTPSTPTLGPDESILSTSLPTHRASILAYASTNNLLAAGGFLDLSASSSGEHVFTESVHHESSFPLSSSSSFSRSGLGLGGSAAIHPTLTHSHTIGNLRPLQGPPPSPSPTDWSVSGSNAIPIHSSSSFRPRAGSHALPSHLSSSPAGATHGGSGYSPNVTAVSSSPPTSYHPSPTLTALAAPPSDRLAVGRSWSLIEHGKKFLLGSSKKSHNPIASASSSSSTPPPVVASSWSGGGVTHIPLPSDLSTPAARNHRARAQSFIGPPSSALTAHTNNILKNENHALKSVLGSSHIPAAFKSQLNRIFDHSRDLDRTIDEYKGLLTKLWTRRRQVLGTLNSSLHRLSTTMQVAKLEVLQQLVTIQTNLFDTEENMLRHACILLKEQSAISKAGCEELQEGLTKLSHILLRAPSSSWLPSSSASSETKQMLAELQQTLAYLPPPDLITLISGPAPRAYALSHPLLADATLEHKTLSARLESMKARYLATSKATDLEELQPRHTRWKKVITQMTAAMQQRQHANGVDGTPSAVGSPDTASHMASASASLPSHTACREIELDFARLLLDERSKEGRACQETTAEMEKKIEQVKTIRRDQKRRNNVNHSSHIPILMSSTNEIGLDHVDHSLSSTPHSHTRSVTLESCLEETATSIDANSEERRNGAPNHTNTDVESNPAPTTTLSPAHLTIDDLHHSCYELLSTLLSRLDRSLSQSLSLDSVDRSSLRILLQRTIFPRMWSVLMKVGFEREDWNGLPELPDTSIRVATITTAQHTSDTAGVDNDEDDMSRRERWIDWQLRWLRKTSPVILGVPESFLTRKKEATPTPIQPIDTPSTIHSSLPSIEAPLPTASPPRTPTRTPSAHPSPAFTPGSVRAPPSHKPLEPGAVPFPHPSAPSTPASTPSLPVQAPHPWSPKSYQSVIDLFEELGGLSAPSDMVACLLAASKEIYVAAKAVTDAKHPTPKQNTNNSKHHQHDDDSSDRDADGDDGDHNASVGSSVGALGADSFFPIFLYALIQSSVRNWLHRLKLMQRYALTGDELMAEPAYYLTTLEAAIIFIQQATIDNLNTNHRTQVHTPTLSSRNSPLDTKCVHTNAAADSSDLPPLELDSTHATVTTTLESPDEPHIEPPIANLTLVPPTASTPTPTTQTTPTTATPTTTTADLHTLEPAQVVPSRTASTHGDLRTVVGALPVDSLAGSHPLFSSHTPYSPTMKFDANDI